MIPGYKAIRQGAKTGYEEYKKLSYAQTFLDKPGQSWTNIQQGYGKILGVDRLSAEGKKQLTNLFFSQR